MYVIFESNVHWNRGRNCSWCIYLTNGPVARRRVSSITLMHMHLPCTQGCACLQAYPTSSSSSNAPVRFQFPPKTHRSHRVSLVPIFFGGRKLNFWKRHFFSNSRPMEAVQFSGKFIFSKREGKIEEYVLISRGEKLRIPSSFHSPSKKRSSNNHVFRLLYDYPPRASKTDLSIPSTRCSIERPSSIEQTRATCTWQMHRQRCNLRDRSASFLLEKMTRRPILFSSSSLHPPYLKLVSKTKNRTFSQNFELNFARVS